MADSQMDLDEFKAAFAAGGVTGVTVEAVGTGFSVLIKTRSGSGALVSIKERKPRVYQSANKALALLFEIGMRKNIAVDLSSWTPEHSNLR